MSVDDDPLFAPFAPFALFPLCKRTRESEANQEANEEANQDTNQDTNQELYQLRPSEIKKARDAIAAKQDGRCYVCQESFLNSKATPCLDHQHKRKRSDPNGVDGAGCLRGVLCSACNVLEGKIWNVSYRHKRTKHQIPTLLRRLALYYEEGWYPCIHPSEKPRAPKVSKLQYNRLKKKLLERRPNAKMPPFPQTKAKKITKALEKLFTEFDIDPYVSRSTK